MVTLYVAGLRIYTGKSFIGEKRNIVKTKWTKVPMLK